MTITFLLLFAGACFGWGRLVTWLCYHDERTSAAYNMILGIAVLTVLGGLLNLFRAVSNTSLHLLLGGGLAVTAFFSVRALRRRLRSGPIRNFLPSDKATLCHLVPTSLALLLTLFWGWALLPTAAFNVFDDFHCYLVRPIRMLASGTLTGNPFDSLGLDSFGAQSFFHCFVLACRPITDLNAFDGVICFGLCALLIVAIARELDIHWGFSVLVLLAFVSINPQVVNVSAVYSGAAMILGLMAACSSFATRFTAGTLRVRWPHLVPISLFASTLVSLKNTLAVFAFVALLIFFTVLFLRSTITRRHTLLAASLVALGTFFLVLSWLFVVPMTYGAAAKALATSDVQAPGGIQNVSMVAHDAKALLAPQQLFYGGNTFYYNFAVLCVAVCGVIALWHIVRKKTPPVPAGWLICMAAVGCSLPVLYVINAHVFDGITGIRYSCPLILATFPLASLIAAKLLTAVARPIEVTAARPILRPLIWPLAANLTVIFLFLSTTSRRFDTAVNARTQLAYAIDQTYLDFHHAALTRSTVQYVRSLQALTQPGATIFAWSETSFFLDFRRNQIVTATESGMINPLLRFPVDVPPDALREYLLALGIRYVLFQSDGFAVFSVPELVAYNNHLPLYRKFTHYSIYAKSALSALAEQHRVLHRNEHTVLVDLTVSKFEQSQNITGSQPNGPRHH
jgi:hypothetical protein